MPRPIAPRINILQALYGIADYVLGGLLMIAPWLFGFADHLAATATTAGLGALILAYSAVTDYEISAYRKLPMPVHLALDGLCGGLLIGAPFMFGFADRTWVPHLVMGIVTASIAVAATLGYAVRHMPRRLAHVRAVRHHSDRAHNVR